MSAAGLIPVMRLAENAGLHEVLGQRLSVDSPNPVAKSASIVAGMLAGADSIDDLDLLRHGAMEKVFGGVWAPSTLGAYLRSFTHGHVQQLDAVAARLLTGLASRVSTLLAGSEEIAYVDVDDTIWEVHGYAKQGAAFGYSGVRRLNAQVAALSTPTAALVIVRARLRRGNVASHTGAGRLLAQAIAAARAAGVTGQILARADSAYLGHAFAAAALRAGAWFSVTARMSPQIRAATASIEESAWTAITYPNAVYDEDERRWISDAEVAETEVTIFTSRRTREHVTCRLAVRRVRRLNSAATSGRTSCSPPSVITDSSPTRPRPRSRPTPDTVTMRPSSRSSPNSRTDRSRTCRRGSTRRTRPGWHTRPSPSTSPAPPVSRPGPVMPAPGGRRCAPT
ncbi:mobile element protein [Rhodococcus aetherivorans]|uniref:Mobile element protein n=1 Tax=Rhodococcus aetherivorans TaxID=191292 RepID=A0ABQ0YI96_9NOCA|nr:mobile element protein [Rhodococcus aetherivorans]